MRVSEGREISGKSDERGERKKERKESEKREMKKTLASIYIRFCWLLAVVPSPGLPKVATLPPQPLRLCLWDLPRHVAQRPLLLLRCRTVVNSDKSLARSASL